MELINLLDFLNKAKELSAPDYTVCDDDLLDFIDIVLEDEQFIQKIDLGLIFLSQRTMERFHIVDGFNRLLSMSLLLHAICECYKKTTPQNEKAIKIIRTKYLLNGDKTKLRLPEDSQIIYNKIIFGERLSGKEKKSKIFSLLHVMWSKIKEEELQALKIFNTLQKIFIYKVETEYISNRDLYFSLNKDNKFLNQILLIESYLKEAGVTKEWLKVKNIFRNKNDDLMRFLNDFFITKFSGKMIQKKQVYEIFVNYFETMMRFMPEDVFMSKFIRSAQLYKNILNINFEDERFRDALIHIKMHNGDDTLAYILTIYEDYLDKNLSEATFYEILLTIDEYLKNRQKTPNNVEFNELIQYLNTFITCK